MPFFIFLSLLSGLIRTQSKRVPESGTTSATTQLDSTRANSTSGRKPARCSTHKCKAKQYNPQTDRQTEARLLMATALGPATPLLSLAIIIEGARLFKTRRGAFRRPVLSPSHGPDPTLSLSWPKCGTALIWPIMIPLASSHGAQERRTLRHSLGEGKRAPPLLASRRARKQRCSGRTRTTAIDD